MTPLVSIVVPAYNAAPYVAATLRSALAQTHPRVEVLVVNDGSRDGTLAAARQFESGRVRVIDQENRGAAAARNRGLREAQGEFIQFLDADDLLDPTKIEVQLRRLRDQSDTVAACRWGRFTTDPSAACVVAEPFWRDMDPPDWLVSCWERHSMMHPAAWLVPRPVIDRSGAWDEALKGCPNDDGEFFTRVVLASRRILFEDGVAVYYRSGMPHSLSQRVSEEARRLVLGTYFSGTERLLRLTNELPARRACCRCFEEFYYATYPDVPELRRRAWSRIRELGGPYFRPPMGWRMRAVSRVVGWRGAKRLGRWLSRKGGARE